MERACVLLKAGYKVVDACVKVGFTSTSSFSRLFSFHFGYPPSEIRVAANGCRRSPMQGVNELVEDS
jgi:AraC-like DNA-binding protein